MNASDSSIHARIISAYAFYVSSQGDTTKCTELAYEFKHSSNIQALNLMFELAFNFIIQYDDDWMVFLMSLGITNVIDFINNIYLELKLVKYIVNVYKLNSVSVLTTMLTEAAPEMDLDLMSFLIEKGAQFDMLDDNIIIQLIDNECCSILDRDPKWLNYVGAAPYIRNRNIIQDTVIHSINIPIDLINIIVSYLPYVRFIKNEL